MINLCSVEYISKGWTLSPKEKNENIYSYVTYKKQIYINTKTNLEITYKYLLLSDVVYRTV